MRLKMGEYFHKSISITAASYPNSFLHIYLSCHRDEECDAGDDDECGEDYGCTQNCVCEKCGDEIINGGEQCDGPDGDCGDYDCNSSCRCEFCGDGEVNGDEQCEGNSDCPGGQVCVDCQCQATCKWVCRCNCQ